MHYQQSQKRLEPERLSAPDDAVPVTGGRPAYTFDQATALQNPIVRDPQAVRRAQEIYRVNCAMCHGVDGHGKSAVAQQFANVGAVPPVDFASDRVRSRTDGQLYWIVTNGLGNMPAFGKMLSERDVWTVLLFIHDAQGRP